jgi:hypothetical protein
MDELEYALDRDVACYVSIQAKYSLNSIHFYLLQSFNRWEIAR